MNDLLRRFLVDYSEKIRRPSSEPYKKGTTMREPVLRRQQPWKVVQALDDVMGGLRPGAGKVTVVSVNISPAPGPWNWELYFCPSNINSHRVETKGRAISRRKVEEWLRSDQGILFSSIPTDLLVSSPFTPLETRSVDLVDLEVVITRDSIELRPGSNLIVRDRKSQGLGRSFDPGDFNEVAYLSPGPPPECRVEDCPVCNPRPLLRYQVSYRPFLEVFDRRRPPQTAQEGSRELEGFIDRIRTVEFR